MKEVISKARQLAGVRIRKALYGHITLSGMVVGYEGDCLVIAYTTPAVKVSYHAERTPTNPTLLCEVPAGHSLLLTEPSGVNIWEVDKEAERMRREQAKRQLVLNMIPGLSLNIKGVSRNNS